MRASTRIAAVWLGLLAGASTGSAQQTEGSAAAQRTEESVPAPGTEGFAPSDGVNIFYRLLGDGDPLLLINGGPGWSSDHMLGVAERLAESNRVILYDQRGTGRSELATVDPSTVSLEFLVADMEALRRHLGVDRWTVMGHSFGGLLAMAYAAEHSDRIRAMVLSAPAGADLDLLGHYPASLRERLLPHEREAADFWGDPERLAAAPQKAGYEVLKASVGAFLYDRSQLTELLDAVDETTWDVAVAQLVWSDLIEREFDVRADMRAFQAPVLVIQGRQDALGTLSAHQIAERFPHGRLVVVEKAAHILWLDQPDRYFEAVTRFLGEERP